PSGCCPAVGPGMRNDIDHGLFFLRRIVRSIHVIHIEWFFPWCQQSFIINRTNPVQFAVSFSTLYTSWIIMRCEKPHKMSGRTIFRFFSHSYFHFHQLGHSLFCVSTSLIECSFVMQIQCSPCTIFTNQYL